MAEQKSSARLRADAGEPTAGVIHIRTRLNGRFTVIANALAQRCGSAVTVGVATYILSLPDGAPVTITALCQHFQEGEILIARALNDLETDGYLERRKERGGGGRIRTRTYAHDVPERHTPAETAQTTVRAPSGEAARRQPPPTAQPDSPPAAFAPRQQPAAPALSDADPRANGPELAARGAMILGWSGLRVWPRGG